LTFQLDLHLTDDLDLSPSSDSLGHMEGVEHELKCGPFQVGPSKVGLLKVTARKVAVLEYA